MRLYIRSRTVSYGLSRSCTIANTIIHGHVTRVRFLKVLKILHGFHGWPECNSNKAKVARFYVRFTRMANRISRVFCVRQALQV